ncbi:F-box family protein [Euphorbia peplus]|nr:F-box family protein [Euphorbia peplus]
MEETDDEYVLVNFEEEKDVCLLQQEDMIIVNFKEKGACSEEDMLEPHSDDDDDDDDDDGSVELNFNAPLATDPSLEHIGVLGRHMKLKNNLSIDQVVKEHALAFLPAKSLYKCKAVSKQWERWITNPFFIHQHTLCFKNVSGLFCQHPGEMPSFISLDPSAFGVRNPTLKFLPEWVAIRATSNGLLCCRGYSENQAYYICNPVTEEWRKLPEPCLYHGPRTGIALVFEPSTLGFASHFEVIAVVRVPDSLFQYFEIYSSRTNSWRITETVCCESNIGETNGDGFYMKGYAYWEMESGVVLAYNMTHEQYGIISLPACNAPVGALTEMDGRLCYLFPKEDDDHNYSIEVYGTMKMNLKHVIPVSSGGLDVLCNVVCFVNDDTLILELGEEIIAYHVSERRSKILSYGSTDGFTKYLPYVNSLVPVAIPVAEEME